MKFLLLLFLCSCSITDVPIHEEVPIRDIGMELDMMFNTAGG